MLAKRSCLKRAALGGGALALALLTGLWIDASPLLFRSAESRTQNGAHVYNEITWFRGDQQDVWMLRQSHEGLTSARETWDRLAIIIDKQQGDARFVQLAPGAFDARADGEQRPFRAACYMCHPNGPRAIRPDADGPKLSAWDRARLALWNLRIKTYGRLREHASNAPANPERVKSGEMVPFRYPGRFANERLTVKTCVGCHNDEGRGYLTRQHQGAIEFMLKGEHMPPLGFALNEGEREELELFIRGL